MSRAEQQESRISYLLRNLCDERLNEDEAAELSQLLATSNSARRRYVELVQLCVGLADWSHASGPVSIPYPAAATGVNGKATLREPARPVVSKEIGRRQRRISVKESTPARRWNWFHPWLTWGAAAAMLLAISLYGWS